MFGKFDVDILLPLSWLISEKFDLDNPVPLSWLIVGNFDSDNLVPLNLLILGKVRLRYPGIIELADLFGKLYGLDSLVPSSQLTF